MEASRAALVLVITVDAYDLTSELGASLADGL
jgi:hypothetical protein